MNLLFYSTVFPDADHPSRGTYNFELCSALAKAHLVRVVAPREWLSVLKRLTRRSTFQAGETIRGAGIEADYPTYWYPPKMFRGEYGTCLWRSTQRAVQRLAGSFVPDGMLSYWAHPDGEAALRIARGFRVPAVVIVGGSDVLQLPNCPRRGARVRQVLQQSDAVVTVSEGLRESVIELGIDPSRVHTVYQGVNPLFFHSENRSVSRSRSAGRVEKLGADIPLLLWVGRLVSVKRLDVLIDSCAILRRQGREFVLALAGTGPLQKALKQQVASNGLTENVCFLGAQTSESLGDWYRAADCTVMSSDSEGLPNVLRESLACGTPFVSTDVGSIREIADERYSILTPGGDPGALAEAILTVLDGPHQQCAEQYSARTWNDTAGDILKVFSDCGQSVDVSASHERLPMGVGS